ncbi:MAG: hypothetical protein KC501_13655 [Myxococcales bacterium]|nr:hypothetical protein [Myxococcales bacterium]
MAAIAAELSSMVVVTSGRWALVLRVVYSDTALGPAQRACRRDVVRGSTRE